MAQNNEPRYRIEKARERTRESAADGEFSDETADRIIELSKALDENHLSVNGEFPTKSDSTVENYTRRLRIIARAVDKPLIEFDTDEINDVVDGFASGSHPDVKDDGYAEGTMIQFVSALKFFYRYHGGDVDPDSIPVPSKSDTSVDERDMFTQSEIQAMRDVIDNPRDKALFELLLNTGQRIRAIQTLRVKDIDVEEGVYWLNTEADGLKGADKTGSKRPLLGAQGPVYEWLQYHPTGEPDDYLITPMQENGSNPPGNMLAKQTIGKRLRRIAEKAGVDKPANAHNFRHNFVTMCKREYDMDNDTIKFLIGHKADSKIMETTYQHLTDDDYIQDAEIAAGYREEEDSETLGRRACPNPHCTRELEVTAKACPSCGTTITPDAKNAQDQIEEDMKQEYRDTDPEDTDTQEKIDALDELLDDPDVKAALLEKLAE